MKHTVTILPVNLQQGFLLDDSNRILGAYSHHNKKIYGHLTGLQNADIPENYKDYDLIHQVDHFSVSRWTNENGDISI